MSLTNSIREVLRSAGAPMTSAQVADALGDASRDTVMTLIYQRRKVGEFIATIEDGKAAYSINPDFTGARVRAEKVLPPPAATSKKPRLESAQKKARKAITERKRDYFLAAESAEKTLKALKFSADTAADAVEVYVCSVVDPVTYTALKNARLSSLAALEAFIAQGRQ